MLSFGPSFPAKTTVMRPCYRHDAMISEPFTRAFHETMVFVQSLEELHPASVGVN